MGSPRAWDRSKVGPFIGCCLLVINKPLEVKRVYAMAYGREGGKVRGFVAL